MHLLNYIYKLPIHKKNKQTKLETEKTDSLTGI